MINGDYIIFMLKLVFVLTTECNLGCKHCLRGHAAPQHLSFDIIKKVVAGAQKFGIESVHLTGGEPFLYKNLAQVFELARHYNLPVSFSSNGHLLLEKTDLIEKYKNNIKLINISVESRDPHIYEQIRGKGNFEKVLKGLDFCRRRRVPFGIINCLNKLNVSDVSGAVKFAKKQKAGCITFSAVLPCTNSLENNLVLSEEERKKALRELMHIMRLASLDFFKIFYIPVYSSEPVRASNNIIMCSNMALHYFVVDVDASAHFCCFLTVYDAGAEVEKRLRIVSLEKVSFDEAVVLLSQAMHRFVSNRIEDYKKSPDLNGLDFNSCFYCNRKLGISG